MDLPFKSLKEIDNLIEADPNYYRYYLMRVNHYARTSKNKVVKSCGIPNLCNLVENIVYEKLESRIESLANYLESHSDDQILEEVHKTLRKIVEDFANANRVLSNVVEFRENLVFHNFKKFMESKPTTSLQFLARGVLVSDSFKNKISLQFADYTKAIELNPYNYEAFFALGELYMDIGKLEEALEYLTKAIDLEPRFYLAYRARGHAHHHNGRFRNSVQDLHISIEFLEKVVEDETELIELSDTYYNLGKSYDSMNDMSNAAKYYSTSIELHPKNLEPYNNRGFVFMRQGKLELSLNDFNTALKLKFDDPNCVYGRGSVFMLMKRFGDAVKDYTFLIERKQTFDWSGMEWFPYTYEYRGTCLVNLDRFEEALLDFTNGLSLGCLNCENLRGKTVQQWKKKIMKL